MTFHIANDICVSSCESSCKCVDVCLGKKSVSMCVFDVLMNRVKIMSSSCFPLKIQRNDNNVIILRTIQVSIYIRVKHIYIFIIFYNLYYY